MAPTPIPDETRRQLVEIGACFYIERRQKAVHITLREAATGRFMSEGKGHDDAAAFEQAIRIARINLKGQDQP